jgi:hypothetical protein
MKITSENLNFFELFQQIDFTILNVIRIGVLLSLTISHMMDGKCQFLRSIWTWTIFLWQVRQRSNIFHLWKRENSENSSENLEKKEMKIMIEVNETCCYSKWLGKVCNFWDVYFLSFLISITLTFQYIVIP